MKAKLIGVSLLILSLITVGAARAQAMDVCPHDATVQSLQACVQHARSQGFIDNGGIARSLLAKLDATQAALARGQLPVAINALEAVVHELDAQAGKHILAEHATHLRMHAQMVIQALKP